ncbi:MAG: hypothetical protein ACLGG5_09225 [Thermoleophilia bacterium]
MIREKAKWLVVALTACALGTAVLTACGGSTSGSDQFRTKTGSPLLDFGEESSDAEQEEAADVVQAFFLARGREDWQATCAQLSPAMLDKIEHLATSSTDLKDPSCPSFLEAFLSLSEQERQESTVEAGSLRQQGAKGFLIYYGAGEVVYAMPLSKDGDGWKVASLSPKRLS